MYSVPIPTIRHALTFAHAAARSVKIISSLRTFCPAIPNYTSETHLFDDRELWKQISAGDAGAFEAWYRDTAPRLRVFLRHLTGSEPAADDLMQESYSHIWGRPQGFDPERGTLRAWLFGIARKQAAEWWRKQRPFDSLPDEGAAPAIAESHSILADVFNRIPPDGRALLWLREVEGHSYAELAVILDIPVGTVRSRLFAAREALRDVWHGAAPTKGGCL
jgi:RNA polymerase sigma-70 factor, ECF subfamily